MKGTALHSVSSTTVIRQPCLWCMRYSKNRDDAEDILQEAFIKIFKSIKNFRGQSTLGYWIKRIVVNTALNYQRSKLYLFPMVELNDISYSSGNDQIIANCSLEEEHRTGLSMSFGI